MKKIICCLLFNSFLINLQAQKFSILKDIVPGKKSSYPNYLVLAENKLFFAAADSLHGNELWMSEGTAITTNLAVDLNPGKANSNPANLIYMNGALYFTADDGINGIELWKLKFSSMALTKLTNTTVLSPFGFKDAFIVYNNNLYFSFDDGVHGAEVWRTNGTIAGTKIVEDVRPGLTGTISGQFFIFNNILYYVGADDIDTQALYSINSSNNTKKVFNCGEGGCFAFTPLNDAFYFFSDDQVFSNSNTELYTSDGTTAGTHIVKDINPNGTGTYFSMVASGNELYFTGDDGVHGLEPWKSDGTANGTKLIKDITPGSGSSTPTDMIAYNNKVIFQAYQNNIGGAWITDGTANGTIKIGDILVDNEDQNFIEVSNKLLFVGYVNNYGYELCLTDGTPAGTNLALDINKGIPSSFPAFFTPKEDSLFFTATDDKKGDEVFYINPLNFTVAAAANGIAKNIASNEKITLGQNNPNPFTNTSNIQYMLPDNYSSAFLVFTSQKGNVVKTIALKGSGINTVNINADEFIAGVYFYSLVINGKVIASKSCLISK